MVTLANTKSKAIESSLVFMMLSGRDDRRWNGEIAVDNEHHIAVENEHRIPEETKAMTIILIDVQHRAATVMDQS